MFEEYYYADYKAIRKRRKQKRKYKSHKKRQNVIYEFQCWQDFESEYWSYAITPKTSIFSCNYDVPVMCWCSYLKKNAELEEYVRRYCHLLNIIANR